MKTLKLIKIFQRYSELIYYNKLRYYFCLGLSSKILARPGRYVSKNIIFAASEARTLTAAAPFIVVYLRRQGFALF